MNPGATTSLIRCHLSLALYAKRLLLSCDMFSLRLSAGRPLIFVDKPPVLSSSLVEPRSESRKTSGDPRTQSPFVASALNDRLDRCADSCSGGLCVLFSRKC